MSGTTDKKVSTKEVERVLLEGLQGSDLLRAGGLQSLSRYRGSKAKMLAREGNRLSAKYNSQHPRARAADAKFDANVQYINGLKMEATRAATTRGSCDESTWAVEGRVYDRSGCPVGNAEVATFSSDGQRVEQFPSAVTDARGMYRISHKVGKTKRDALSRKSARAPAGKTSGEDDSAAGASGIRVNAKRQTESVFVRAVDGNDASVCADSTLMVPKLGQCNYRDLVFDSNVVERLVSDIDKGRRSSRYLGNSATRELHDLKNEKSGCQIDEIRADRLVRFKSIEESSQLGYDLCAYCFGKERSRR